MRIGGAVDPGRRVGAAAVEHALPERSVAEAGDWLLGDVVHREGPDLGAAGIGRVRDEARDHRPDGRRQDRANRRDEQQRQGAEEHEAAPVARGREGAGPGQAEHQGRHAQGGLGVGEDEEDGRQHGDQGAEHPLAHPGPEQSDDDEQAHGRARAVLVRVDAAPAPRVLRFDEVEGRVHRALGHQDEAEIAEGEHEEHARAEHVGELAGVAGEHQHAHHAAEHDDERDEAARRDVGLDREGGGDADPGEHRQDRRGGQRAQGRPSAPGQHGGRDRPHDQEQDLVDEVAARPRSRVLGRRPVEERVGADQHEEQDRGHRADAHGIREIPPCRGARSGGDARRHGPLPR